MRVNFIALFLLLLLFLVAKNISAQEIKTKYVFSMMPKDEQWKKHRYPERVKILQVDSLKLKKMTNIELIGSCYEYPFYINFFAFNTFDEGFKNVCSLYNGYNEILERKDNIADDLIQFYDAMGINGFNSPFEIYNENYSSIKMYLFEYILSLDKIISSLNAKQQKNLYLASRKKFYLKEKNFIDMKDKALFSNFGIKSSMRIICKLAKLNEKSMNLKLSTQVSEFLYQGRTDEDFHKSIIEFMDIKN